MQRYVRHMLISLGIMMTLFIMNFFINVYLESRMTLDLPGNVLIMGESHVRCGLDPRFIEGSVNVAQPAETIFLTYHKLKKIMTKCEGQFDQVLIGIGHNTVSGINDIKYYDDEYAYEFHLRSYPLMGRSKLREVQSDWRTYLKVMLKQMLLYPHYDHDTYVGGFFPRASNFENSTAEEQITKHYYDDAGDAYAISDQSVNYLDSVIQYCALMSIDLSFIYMPHHQDYLDALPAHVVKGFEGVMMKIGEHDVDLIDLRGLELNDEDYANHDHLSARGAELASRFVDTHLKKER